MLKSWPFREFYNAMREPGSPGLLCQAFNLAGMDEMVMLGAAFSPVVRQAAANDNYAEHGVLRIGEMGESKAGKSRIVHGLVETFPNKVEEESASDIIHQQHTWRSDEFGWIRHYDALRMICRNVLILPSLTGAAKRSFGPPLTEIVEHPECDRKDRFHCLIGINDWDSLARTVFVAAPEELASSPGFQDFLKNARRFQAPLQQPGPNLIY